MAKSKVALITGISGQDGYYLSRYLTDRGYIVIGQTRNPRHIRQHLSSQVTLVSFDLHCSIAWKSIFEEYSVDEVYHLAGVSFVPTSWSAPGETIQANLYVTAQLLEALRTSRDAPRLFYASSSEIFGHAQSPIQNESTPMRPVNPYGVTKAASMGMIDCYRKRYDLFASSGILFNHESPRRDPVFVTRKISKGVAAISRGIQDRLILGNLDVQRDWGYAEDFVDCMNKAIRFDSPGDYVIGTGRLVSLRKLVEVAFRHVGLDANAWVSIDPAFARPNDTPPLVADASKARQVLDWTSSTSIEEVICGMVDYDLRLLEEQETVRRAG